MVILRYLIREFTQNPEGGKMDYDVVVIGAGNAAMCSALAAEEVGAKVLVLEAATEELGGGNTRYTAGAIRTFTMALTTLEN